VSEPLDPALSNVVATLALALTDRIGQETKRATGRGGQAPAAIVALHEFLGGGTIEQLRQTLGLSHSAAVRLVDRLVADGLVLRHEGRGDGRSVALTLTPAGRTAARRVLSVRRTAVEEALAALGEDERRQLQASAGGLITAMTRSRLAQRAAGRPPDGGWMCRLCDFEACGRAANRCPAANAAAAPPRP
jgi:MarR family transcriptional repressor of emrRAB